MQAPVVSWLESPDPVRDHAADWDDLWWRSGVTHPTARADLVADWVERFGRPKQFRAAVVTQAGRWVAALPLVDRKKRHLLKTLDIPGNEWSSAGQLLLDPTSNPSQVLSALVSAVRRRWTRMLWFPSVPLDSPWWQALAQVAGTAGYRVDAHGRDAVGQLDLAENWTSEQARWSSNFRHQLRRAERHLRRRGRLVLHTRRPADPAEAWRQLGAGLQLEDQGWKGAAGTSLLRHPQALELVRQQVARLAAWQQLMLVELRLDERLIAFEYGWLAKRVYHSFKVAYDPELAACSPGQMLVYLLLQRFHHHRLVDRVDFLGPLDNAVSRWRPRQQQVGRLVLAPGRYLQPAILSLAGGRLGTPRPPAR